MIKLDLEKAEEPEIKLPKIIKQENSRKTPTSASLTTLKPLTVWITTNCRKFLKRWEYQTTFPASWEICMQAKKQQLEPDMEKWTGSKLGKEYIKDVYCHPAYLTSVQSEDMLIDGLDEAQAEIKIAWRNINNFRYADDTTLMVESREELQNLLMKVKGKSEKAGWKLNIEKTKIMASSPITSWQIDGETMETVGFSGLQNHCRWWLLPWN